MTIIAATTKAIACDTLGSDQNSKEDFGPKIYEFKNAFAGFSGSYLIGKFLKDELPYEAESIEDIEDIWYQYCRSCPDNNAPGDFIFLSKKGLYRSSCDGSILEPQQGYTAIGSGGPIALGALYANRNARSHGKRLETAIRAAVNHNPYCGGEILICHL